MNRPIKQPTAKLVRDTPNVQTVYLVQWPATAHNAGRSYYVTTYPDSDLVFVETVLKRRPVSPLVGRRIMPAIREALAAVKERTP